MTTLNGKTHAPAKQEWAIGETVQVGFLSLRIIGSKIATPGNYAADEWPMENLGGTRFYRMVPHRGLFRVESRADALNAGATV